MMMPLFGLGLAPLFVAGVLRIMDWRYIFLVFVLPGLALSYAMWRVMPRQSTIGASASGVIEGYEDVRAASLIGRRRCRSEMCAWLRC